MIIFPLKESYYFGTSSVTKALQIQSFIGQDLWSCAKYLALHNVSQGQYAGDHVLLFSILQFQHDII